MSPRRPAVRRSVQDIEGQAVIDTPKTAADAREAHAPPALIPDLETRYCEARGPPPGRASCPVPTPVRFQAPGQDYGEVGVQAHACAFASDAFLDHFLADAPYRSRALSASAAPTAIPRLLRIRTNCVYLSSWEDDETNLTH